MSNQYSRSTPKDSANSVSGRVTSYHGMYIGTVKDNTDAQRTGRLRVWVPELNSLPEDEGSWITVNYCSPFAGATNPWINGEGADKVKKFDETQVAYGFWAVPPDLENQVAVMFANGDLSRGFWFGCLFNQYMNHMVPGHAAGTNHQYPSEELPVAEYNKKTTEYVDPDGITRPYQKTMSEGLTKQGLVRDKVRGTTTSSARREAPSQVYGMSTPGPEIDGKPGKRMGGNHFIMDDGKDSEHIRLRTKSGAQMLLDETNGIVYTINKDGTAWIQMDADGNVDVFGAKSFSVRAEEHINMYADKNIYMEAGQNIFMKAATEDIQMQALRDIHVTAEENYYLTVNKDNMYVLIATDIRQENGGNTDIVVGQNTKLKTGSNLDVKSGSNTNMESGSETNVKAGANFNGESGATMNLKAGASANLTASAGANINGGSAVIVSGGAVHLNGPAAASASSASSAADAQPSTEATIPDVSNKTDILFTEHKSGSSGEMLVFDKDTGTVETIVDRFMTREPCPEHINKGGQ